MCTYEYTSQLFPSDNAIKGYSESSVRFEYGLFKTPSWTERQNSIRLGFSTHTTSSWSPAWCYGYTSKYIYRERALYFVYIYNKTWLWCSSYSKCWGSLFLSWSDFLFRFFVVFLRDHGQITDDQIIVSWTHILVRTRQGIRARPHIKKANVSQRPRPRPRNLSRFTRRPR